jgi:hypothetical protein
MLRPNKNVERKLIASSLVHLKHKFPITDYRYVGFGSMWFTDFILMHRVVGISDMVSIEIEKSREKRVEFNKPFGCISVKMGEAASHLGDVLEQKKSLVWLDYDGGLKNALTGDIETAVGAMESGSIILVSVNAMAEQLKGNFLDEVELPPIDYLRAICDSDLTGIDSKRLTRNDFPILVSQILTDRIKAATLAHKPGCEFFPIWNFLYADDAQMITVGGMIADRQDEATLHASGLDKFSFFNSVSPFEISVPILTDKEKKALDKLLPSTADIKPKVLDFELRPKEILAYQKFYLEYPVFNETVA